MIGFDIGGTKCAVSVGFEGDGMLHVCEKRVIETDLSRSPTEMIDRMCALAEEMTDDLSVIGISCGGPLDSRAGIILSPPNLPGWDEVHIVEYLTARYKGRVALQNDANACAVAEWRYGAGRGTENMIFLTFGSGLGAGLILGGKLYAGSSDMAGEAGHVRLRRRGPVGYGKSGSFEGFCSGNGIAQMGRAYAERMRARGKAVSFCAPDEALSSITAKRIAECANEGCADAVKIYRQCGRMLGEGLSMLIDVLNPECIVIGSVFLRAECLLRDAMEEVIQREALPEARKICRILPAGLGEQLGDYAALSVAASIQNDN